MKTLIALLAAAVLLTATGAEADHRQKSVEFLVQWAGCTADVITSDEHSIGESFYRPGTHELYIGTMPGEIPDELAMMVIFHEAGHCLQQQAGYLDPIAYFADPVSFELDADRWSAELACGLGYDGHRLLHDLWVWAYRTYGYEGDWAHGSIVDRISQSEDTSCHSPLRDSRQAPLLG